MVLDIGAGTSEVAVISMGGIVASRLLRVGGRDLDAAIVNHVKRRYKLLIGQRTAEEIKLEIGSASPMQQAETEIPGRDMASESHKTVVVTSEEIRWVLEKTLSRIIESVKETLEHTPPDLASDIIDRGIMLAGGGALLRGLIERLRHETGMAAYVAEFPCTCVAIGSGRALEKLAHFPRSRSPVGLEAATTSAAFN
jgi:rod shape-determining protein MreB